MVGFLAAIGRALGLYSCVCRFVGYVYLGKEKCSIDELLEKAWCDDSKVVKRSCAALRPSCLPEVVRGRLVDEEAILVEIVENVAWEAFFRVARHNIGRFARRCLRHFRGDRESCLCL